MMLENKMTQTIKKLLLPAVMMIFMLLAASKIYAADEFTVNDEAGLTQALKEQNAQITLGADISLNAPAEVSSDASINGAGHTVTYAGSAEADGVFKVSSGTLSITDLTINAGLNSRTIYVDGGGAASLNNVTLQGRRLTEEGLSVYNAGRLALTGCYITGASHASVNYNGIVYNSGDLTIADGTSVDPESFIYTGTVYNDGTLTMTGGTLGGTGSNANRKDYGAAVTNNGTFTMSGGLITGCKNSEAVLSKGTFIMNGGQIADNISTCVSGMTYNSVMSGGGVLIYSGIFEMYEGAEISGNTGYMGAGVGVYYTGTVFNMYGGTISGNTACIDPTETNFNKNNGCGGGVGIYGGAEFNMYGGAVTGNTAFIGETAIINTMGAGNRSYAGTGLGGGIYIMEGHAEIMGGEITGNFAMCGNNGTDGGLGGGIYIRDDGSVNATVNVTAGQITGNYAEGGGGADIYSGFSEEPTADVICLSIGADAQIGDIYLGTNRTMLGIGSEIMSMSVGSLTSNGRYSIGAAIARYADGVTSHDTDVAALNFTGIADLRLSDDGRELVIGMIDLSRVTGAEIEDTVFTGKPIVASALNATLTVDGKWTIEVPGLNGLRIESSSDDINVGTASISLRGDNIRYTGLVENVTFKITPKPLDTDGISVKLADPDEIFISDGTTQFTPKVLVSLDAQSSDDETAYLTEGENGDYTLIYGDNVEAGSGYIYITATDAPGSNYTGMRAFSFEILDDSYFYDVLGSNDPSAEDYQYYYDAVYWATGKDLISGVGGGNFGVGELATKGEFLIMLWKYAGSPESGKYKDPAEIFADIGADEELCKAAAWGWSEGIVGGTESSGTRCLCADNLLSRADMTVMLWRLSGRKGGVGKLKFADVEAAGYKRSSDIYKSIVWITKNGIAKGYKQGDGTSIFGLTKTCNREHIVTYLYRYDQMNEE